MLQPQYSKIALAEAREALKAYNRGEPFAASKSSVTEAMVLLSTAIGDQVVIVSGGERA